MPLDDGAALGALARSTRIDVGPRVLLGGEDVTEAIRADDVTRAVSAVAAHPAVREVLVQRQQAWVAAHGGGVVEGRDIGSVVLPDATLKVFLTADPAERARRRAAEVADGEAAAVAVAETEAALERRDVADSTRAASPLVAAPGAIVVDSTGKSVDEVVEEVLSQL